MSRSIHGLLIEAWRYPHSSSTERASSSSACPLLIIVSTLFKADESWMTSKHHSLTMNAWMQAFLQSCLCEVTFIVALPVFAGVDGRQKHVFKILISSDHEKRKCNSFCSSTWSSLESKWLLENSFAVLRVNQVGGLDRQNRLFSFFPFSDDGKVNWNPRRLTLKLLLAMNEWMNEMLTWSHSSFGNC